MIYEIRNYHYEPSLINEDRGWATDRAVPCIKERLDLVGFCVSVAEPEQTGG